MGRGCVAALAFVGAGLTVLLIGIAWAIWVNWDPAPPGDSGGRAMGTFAILITVFPLGGLIAGAVAAIIAWQKMSPPRNGE